VNDVDLNKLRVFFAVVEHGGVTGAAKRLALTRSAVSQSVSSLEGALELSLFDRVGKRLLLTREGRLLVERFREHQLELRRTLDEIADARTQVIGPIRVGLFLGFPRVRLARFLAAFSARHARAQVRLLYAPQEDLDARLLRNRLDFVFSFQSRGGASPRITSTRLFEQELVLVGNRRFFSRGFDLDALARTPVIDYYRSDPLIDRWLAHHYGDAGGAAAPEVRVWAATTDLVLELLLQRAGVGVLPKEVAEPWIRRRRLVPVDPGRPALTDFIWLNEVEDGYRGSALTAFREAVLESFGRSERPAAASSGATPRRSRSG
jgi:DNA-binding transcriptional LysR family regulator